VTSRRFGGKGRLTKVGLLVIALVCVLLAAPVLAFVSNAKHSVVVPKLGKGVVTAKCPGSERVAFGGFNAQFDLLHDKIVLPIGMRKSAPGKWTVYGQSGSLTGGSRLGAVAYCSNAKPAITAETTVVVGAGHVGSAVAKCPPGTVVVGGGFNTQAFPHLEVIKGLERVADGAWRASILNVTPGRTKLTSIAYCGPGPAATLKSGSTTLYSGYGGTARATCPTGTALLFGGEIASAPGLAARLPQVISFGLSAESTARLAVAGVNGGGSTGSLTALAYCR
jgi:hypothetical protein